MRPIPFNLGICSCTINKPKGNDFSTTFWFLCMDKYSPFIVIQASLPFIGFTIWHVQVIVKTMRTDRMCTAIALDPCDFRKYLDQIGLCYDMRVVRKEAYSGREKITISSAFPRCKSLSRTETAAFGRSNKGCGISPCFIHS